jgi:hypothetical protein
VTDNDMDEVLLVRPLLKALGLDAPSHLEAVRDDYQDLDCSKIASAHAGGKLSRILIERDANPTFFLSPESDKQDPSTHTQGLDYGPNQIVSTGEVTRNEHQHGLETCADVPITGVRASALNVPDSVTHGDADSDPIDVPQLLDLPSAGCEIELSNAVEGMLTRAADNGMSTAGLTELHSMVREYHGIWRIGLTADPPARLPPLVIKLQHDAVPVRVKLRRYAPLQRAFLSQFVNELVENGVSQPDLILVLGPLARC